MSATNPVPFRHLFYN